MDSARVLLASPNPHLENVAFLLEQSFEKIIQTSYTRYKLETEFTSWNEVYKKISDHNIDFILDMLDEIYEKCAETLAYLPKIWHDNAELHNVFTKEIKEILCSSEKLAEPMKLIQYIRDDISSTKRKDFAKFLAGLDSENLMEFDIELSATSPIPIALKNLTSLTKKTTGIGMQTFLDHMTFLIHLNIAPYALLHAIPSRYPLGQYGMYNLKSYRNKPNLKEFFSTLTDRIQKMLNTEAGFTKLLVKTYSVNSNISRHAGKI